MYFCSGFKSACANAGVSLLILIHGSNLIQSKVEVQYRISPTDAETLTKVPKVHPLLMEQWNATYLIEYRVSLLAYLQWLA